MVAEITMSAQVQFSAFDLPPTLGRTASPVGAGLGQDVPREGGHPARPSAGCELDVCGREQATPAADRSRPEASTLRAVRPVGVV